MVTIRVCRWHRDALYARGVLADSDMAIVRGATPAMYAMSGETLSRLVAATRELIEAGELSGFRNRDAHRFLIDAGA